ncbi:SIS domain-containing protein [Egicoccus halophilus]|uniref:Glucosamine--fructose-6-phosphate aminotransferase n=1 Tax=Egicoccus halophilus TaxID=1670830 RepID=A0A8J3AAA4_9ACTN|nr:SIS domain-containing protein [Egicoccus halophilus]GGI08422.1 glucosamine--fructose-6-phosphate aminotransferase [Egicoccus halophilus]
MSRLHAETAEQPAAVARLLERVVPNLSTLRRELWRDDVSSIVLVARGSSDNAARYAQYLFGIEHRLPVALATPSLGSIYGVEPDFRQALVVAVSQSGQSPDVVGVLDAARRQGRPALAITNDPDSPLADAATCVLELGAGPERSVAATKTYTTSLTALALVAVAGLDTGRRRERLADLGLLPDVLETVLGLDTGAAAAGLSEVEHLLVAGRGLNYATAFEAALKIRELSGVVAEAFSPPDLLHGPIGAVSSGAAALLIAPSEPSLAGVAALAAPLRERGARLAVLSADASLLAVADVPLRLPREPADWLTPVTTIVPAQRLASALAADRGRDLDAPEGLTKVTRTR